MHVGVFLKMPQPGRVKTRLSPPLSPLEAAGLYAAMLGDSLDAAIRSAAGDIVLFHEGPPPSEYLPPQLLEGLLGRQHRLVERAQRGDGLGERLDNALEDAAEIEALPLLFLGSDNPDLPPALIDEALAALTQHELVLGPATDGGAWGIGVARPEPALWRNIPWSDSGTASALVERAAELGWGSTLVSSWPDIDEIDDLRALWDRLSSGDAAPRTLDWLRRWPSRHEHLEP